MLQVRFGSIDVHGGCSPSKSIEDAMAKPIITLTSKPWRGIRLPILRKAIRLGVFLESTTSYRGRFPRLIVQAANGEPITMQPWRFLYRAVFNRYGGELFMAQMCEECIIHEDFGVFLGGIEFQYPLFAAMPRQIECRVHLFELEKHIVQPLTVVIDAK